MTGIRTDVRPSGSDGGGRAAARRLLPLTEHRRTISALFSYLCPLSSGIRPPVSPLRSPASGSQAERSGRPPSYASEPVWSITMRRDDHLETGCAPFVRVTDATGALLLIEWSPPIKPDSRWRFERPLPPPREGKAT